MIENLAWPWSIEKDLLTGPDCIAIAYALLDAGFPPMFSTDVFDNLIAGYCPDKYGFRYELIVRMPEDSTDVKDATFMPWAEVKLSLAHMESKGQP